jgi:hypothetical protein
VYNNIALKKRVKNETPPWLPTTANPKPRRKDHGYANHYEAMG